MSNKLYVNWINIRPLTLEDYQSTNSYITTLINYNENKLNEFNIEKFNLDRQLYIGDIYDTIYNFLYLEIKKYKWFLFETLVNDKIFLFIEIINFIFPLDHIIQEKRWLELTDETKSIYTTAWENLKYAIENKQSLQKIPNSEIEKVFRQLVLYFDENANDDLIDSQLYIKLESHEPINQLVNNIKNKLEEDVEDRDEDDLSGEILKLVNQLDIKYLLTSVGNLPVNEIYNFLLYNIKKIKQSWYGKQIFYEKENKAGINRNTELYQDTLNNFTNNLPIKYQLSLKNIYNFAKSFCRNKNWDLLPHKWIMLNKNDKKYILTKLMKPTGNEKPFMIIRNNLRRLYKGILSESNINDLNNSIFLTIHFNIIDIVYQTLIHKGLLSRIHFDAELTNLDLIPTDQQEKNKHYTNKIYKYVFNKQNRNKYENTNYFLTTKPYKFLDKIRVDKKNIEPYLNKISYNDIENSMPILKYQLTEIPYFDDLAINNAWYRFYAMDWICQISFFHHYINNSIMYVTGATGQGKSTQAPKLFLYALKMIDSNVNGKVACSQPRISPTLDNATQIALQMGVPIEQVEGTIDGKLRSNNFYVQFEYQEDNHKSNNEDYFLTIKTDGRLIEEVYKNITLKKNIKDKNDHFEKPLITTNNMYDVLMIDESHEHNTYMDLLLTLGRNSVYYNNAVKLIIVSATIDQDEPTYRRYYRYINDNLIYPYTYELEELKLDRINVDRRYHIAPPGITTQFKVDDIYLPTNPADNNPTLKSAYQANEKIAIQTIVQICNDHSEGQILVFSIGRAEINNMINELLKLVGDNILIFPFLSEMTEEWKNKVSKIATYLPSFTFDRTKIMDIVFTDDKPEDKVPPNTYTRAIIIATPIAEASITIDKLKFVVDTGFTKVSRYNPLLQTSELSVQKITESSRIQRRGRVGRISDGMVYYMYEEDSRKSVQPEYKICMDNITDNIFKLIASSYQNKTLSSDRNYNKFIKNKQFMYYTDKPLYRGSIENIPPPEYYHDGFHIENIYDIDGRFYIIHPRENLSIRNHMTGKIEQSLRLDTNLYVDTNVMNISDFKIMIDTLLYSQKIVDLNVFDDIDFLAETTEKLGFVYTEIKNMKISKTDISFGIDQLALRIKSTDINYEMILTLLYGIKYNVYDQVLIILICLLSCNFDITSWYGTTKSKMEKDIIEDKRFKKLYGNLNSDYIFFLKFFDLLFNSFPDLVIFKEKISEEEILYEYQNDITEFAQLKNEQNNDYSIPKSFTEYNIKKYNKYNGFMNNDILNNQKGKENIINESRKSNRYIDLLETQIKEINFEGWCKTHCINYKTCIRFIKDYYYYFNSFLSVKERMTKLADKLIIDSIEESEELNIIKSFFQAYGRRTQLAYYIPEISNRKPVFMLFNKGEKENIANIKSVLRNEYISNSLVYTYPEVVLYHSARYNEENDAIDINIISKIETKWIPLILPHIFNKRNMKESKSKYSSINQVGQKIINIDINNISYLVEIDDIILKEYYKEFISRLHNMTGGMKLKSFSSKKLRYNPKIYRLIKNFDLNIINTIDRIYVDNYNVSKLYARSYNKVYYRII
jgi:hypothetical protein